MSQDWKTKVNIEGSEKLGLPFSSAVIVGDLVYVCGQAAYDPVTGELRYGTIEDEADLALSNLKKVLEAADSGLEYVIKVNTFLADLKADFGIYNRIYREYFKRPCPVRTTVGVDLGGLRIEIEAIARVVIRADR
jgi:2-iminobutanoate/2-iminopropanoate deaminase